MSGECEKCRDCGASRDVCGIDCLRRQNAALRAENERLKQEVILAVAHDRQPYPTAEAYEKVCSVLHKKEAEAERLTAIVGRLKDAAEELAEAARACPRKERDDE